MGARKAVHVEALASAALDIVAEAGIAALTLRPLATRLGTTAAVIAYQHGQKDQLVEDVIDHARRREGEYFCGWYDRMGEDTEIPRSLAAQMLEQIICDLADKYRATTILFTELLFNVSGSTQSEALARWIEQRREFGRFVASRLTPQVSYELGTMIEAFLVEECAYTLALGRIEAYQWLRRLCIARLLNGLRPTSAHSADQHVFMACFNTLRGYKGGAAVPDIPQYDGVAETIAQACADIIATNGVAVLTHRAVAQRADMAPSTVAYHFPTQPELIRAGLSRLIPNEQTRMANDGSASYLNETSRAWTLRPYQGFEIARAGIAVALFAMRDEEWCPAAAELRALRGYFLKDALIAQMGDTPFDHLGAQTLIMTSSGWANQHAWLGAERASKLALPLIFDTLEKIRN